MAHRVVQVSFRWVKTNPDVDKVASAIGVLCDDWIRLNVHTWFLWTTRSTTEIYNGLRASLTPEDSVFIIPVDTTAAPGGWAPQFVWDWFRNKAGLIKLGA